MQKTYGLLNSGKFADASVCLFNAISAGETIAEDRPPIWLLALTLFVRPEGADISVWDQAEAEQWISDWTKEGYSITDFFECATSKINAFSMCFVHSIRDISEQPSGASESGEDRTPEVAKQ